MPFFVLFKEIRSNCTVGKYFFLCAYLVFVSRTQIMVRTFFFVHGALYVSFRLPFSPHSRWDNSSQNMTCSPHLVKHVERVSVHLVFGGEVMLICLFPGGSPARRVLNVVGVACVLGLLGHLGPLASPALHQETLADGFKGRALLWTADPSAPGIRVRHHAGINAGINSLYR